jgi:hypothetical protein
MPRKPKTQTPNISAHWERNDTYEANGRKIVKGTELTISGERGRFRFMQHVHNPDNGAEWIDCVGGKRGVKEFRAFRPDRIKTVHYKNKLR